MSTDSNNIQKTYNDDGTRVAVIVMSGYGSGFSSNNPGNPWFIYGNPEFVQMVLDEVDNDTICNYVSRMFPRSYMYMAPRQALYIEWVPVGSMFKIREYDGSEAVEILDASEWFTA